MNSEPLNGSPVNVTLDDTWIEFTINGQAVKVEAFEANDVLAELDRRHEADANECLDCGATAGLGGICQHCQSKRLRARKTYRDDLAATLASDLGFPAMSGRTALQVRAKIFDVIDSKKNESTTTPALPSGSDSTPDQCPPPAGEPG